MYQSKQEWLFQLRKCTTIDTLEKIIERSCYYISENELESFNSAADHRMAELITHKLYDKVPASVWHLVR